MRTEQEKNRFADMVFRSWFARAVCDAALASGVGPAMIPGGPLPPAMIAGGAVPDEAGPRRADLFDLDVREKEGAVDLVSGTGKISDVLATVPGQVIFPGKQGATK